MKEFKHKAPQGLAAICFVVALVVVAAVTVDRPTTYYGDRNALIAASDGLIYPDLSQAGIYPSIDEAKASLMIDIPGKFFADPTFNTIRVSGLQTETPECEYIFAETFSAGGDGDFGGGFDTQTLNWMRLPDVDEPEETCATLVEYLKSEGLIE